MGWGSVKGMAFTKRYKVFPGTLKNIDNPIKSAVFLWYSLSQTQPYIRRAFYEKTRGRLLSLVLAVLLCVAVLPTGSARAMGDAMSLDQVKALMNAETLYPQKTGYIELDRMLEELVAPYKGKDTYTTLKGLYDWTVNNIDYSWDGYSQNYAPAYDCFTLTYDLTYETGLPQAYPIDMIYRAYHMLTARTGVCYDWGILFAVMARYVGVESYVHTGILRIGTWTGHHGWTELRLGGKNYIFDGQQDWRSKGIYGRIVYDHFGISMDNAWRYQQETAANGPGTPACCRWTPPGAGGQRDGEHLPLRPGAGRRHPALGEEVTLTSAGELPVVGWYTPAGRSSARSLCTPSPWRGTPRCAPSLKGTGLSTSRPTPGIWRT